MKTTSKLLVCLCLNAMMASRGYAKEVLPNFVLIFTDDQGYEDVGCYGSPNIKTPHLDRMAAEGIRFSDFYAQPVCGPSRAALMTGCYPLRVAERGNLKREHPAMHSEEITIAELLKTKGYVTGAFGKWDMALHRQRSFEKDLMPNHQGFDYYFGTPSSNDGFVDLYRNEKLVEQKADMNTLTQRYTDEVLQFIRKHKDGPFFVYMPHTMPHTRLGVSPAFKGRSKRGLYGDIIEEIDGSTGRIVKLLKELDLADSTYGAFISDNGPWMKKNPSCKDGRGPQDRGGSAGPLRSGKVSTWEGGIRVPSIWWAPGGIPQGQVCSRIASTMDVLPTFARLAGVPLPTDRIIDGEDITHLLKGRFSEADDDKTFFGYMDAELQTVRRGRWKLHLPRKSSRIRVRPNTHIHPDDDGPVVSPVLYDLETDIGETTDVAEAHPKVVAALLKLAAQARDDIGDIDHVGKGARFFDNGEKRPGRKGGLE